MHSWDFLGSFRNSIVFKNMSMLYLFSIANLVFPMLTLPYLTRMLSVEYYGICTYVKSCMSYIAILLEFGFLLSATKDVVKAQNDCIKMSQIVGTVTQAKLLLSTLAFICLLLMSRFLPILQENKLFTLLSFGSVVITALIPDYLFRGLNAMEIITCRFIACKLLSTVFTFFMIHCDEDIIFIPILDLLSSILALLLSASCMFNRNIKIIFVPVQTVLSKVFESFTYFISNFATTAFGALCTLLIGFYLNIEEVAYWSLSMMLISAAQSLYTPIMNGIYPYMVQKPSLDLIKKIIAIFTPLIFVACLITYLYAPLLLVIVGGKKYAASVPILQMLLPMLFISFFSMLVGWPCLGAINKPKATSLTTMVAALFQILSLFSLIFLNWFTISNIIITRTVAEMILLLTRGFFCYKYRQEFISSNEAE